MILTKLSWVQNSVIYQIYPRSFKDSNNDGVGDLKGIIEKLDYLNGKDDSLGVNAIWITPFFASPMVDFGYDVSNYTDIEPVFGNLADFEILVKKAHERGIKIIIDFVPNHSSDQHPWFKESKSSLKNPKRDYYIWSNPKKDGSPPNNWLSVFGGSAWEYDGQTSQYYLHSFFSEQPDLNLRNKNVLKELSKILQFWLKKGVDGFRIDAVNHFMKDINFRDEPKNPKFVPGKDDPYDSLKHIYTKNHPDIFDVLNVFCQTLTKHEDKFIVTEAYLDIPNLVKYYKACSKKCCYPFNFNFIYLPWKAHAFGSFVNNFEKALSAEYLPIYVLGNHDRSRVASRLGQKAARVAAMLLLTLRGIPFVYYGDELGMEDVPIPSSKIHDPFELKVPGLKLGRDPERTPMQWEASKYSGFSSKEPWLPLSSDYKEHNIAKELKDKHSILNLYRKLIYFRKNSPALSKGTYEEIKNANKDVFAYLRKFESEKILVLLNFSSKIQGISIKGLKKAKIICNTALDKEGVVNLKNFKLGPNEGYVFSI